MQQDTFALCTCHICIKAKQGTERVKAVFCTGDSTTYIECIVLFELIEIAYELDSMQWPENWEIIINHGRMKNAKDVHLLISRLLEYFIGLHFINQVIITVIIGKNVTLYYWSYM